jgi:transposase
LEQNPAMVARWLAETYPAIRAQARREGGVVLWLAEMGVRSDAAAGRSWAPVGQTPVIKRTGKRFRVNMISAISNAGMLRFRLFTGSFSGSVLIDFLGRLLRDCGGQKVHLLVDGHPVHRARLVSTWAGRHADRIELPFLPGYSPELNPVELLNHDVKATLRAGGVPDQRVSSAMSCAAIYVAGNGSRRFWSASSITPRPVMPPPHEPHHLPAPVIALRRPALGHHRGRRPLRQGRRPGPLPGPRAPVPLTENPIVAGTTISRCLLWRSLWSTTRLSCERRQT